MLEFHRYPDFTPTPTEYDEMIDDLEKKIEKLEEQINDLDFENGELQDEIEHLKATRIPIDWIKKHIIDIRSEVDRLIEEEDYTNYELCDDANGMERLLEDWKNENVTAN